MEKSLVHKRNLPNQQDMLQGCGEKQSEKSNIVNIEMPVTQIVNSGGAGILKFTYLFFHH